MRYFFLLFCLFPSTFMSAQAVQRLRANAMHGFIIPHAADLRPVADNNPYGLTLAWQMMPTSQQYWEACNCFHYLGIELTYFNFRDREVLGDAFTLAGTFEPVLWNRGKWFLSLHTGIGATWLTRVYDADTNPLNNFFSSNLSFLLFVAPSLEYRVSQNWGLMAGFYYNHISNGGQKQPNRGMNFPMWSAGATYMIRQAELPVYAKIRPDKKFHFWLEMGLTTRNTGFGDERKPYYSFVSGLYRPLTAINAFGAGMEGSMDQSVPPQYTGSKYALAPFLSHHFLLGRFDFSQRYAWYAITPADSEEFQFFQRYALFFNPFSRFSMGMSLKAHGHKAQNLDLRIAWKW